MSARRIGKRDGGFVSAHRTWNRDGRGLAGRWAGLAGRWAGLAGRWAGLARLALGAPAVFGLALGAFGSAGCVDDAYCYRDCDGVTTQGTGGAGGAGGTGGDNSGVGGLFTGSGGGTSCGADLQNDVQNCGKCDNACALASAFPKCVEGTCVIDTCVDGTYDIDSNPATGCEYACPVPVLTPEACNGIDDDCDGLVDAQDPDLAPPGNLCTVTPGTPCESTVVQCNGAMGWSCVYGPEVEVVAGFVRLTETRCDGLDGNCDGSTDEWFVTLGDACSDGALGKCADEGVVICDPQDAAKTLCDLSVAPDPLPPTEELCNGVDDDCNGLVDDAIAVSAYPMQLIPGTMPAVYVDRYEASRPDATGMSPGLLELIACSTPGSLPWTGGSYTEAEAACAARGPGFRLCTAAEFEMACRGASDTTYPYGASYDGAACNGVDNPMGMGMAALPAGSIAMCAAGAPGAFDLSGNVTEWTSTQTNASPAPDRIFQLHGGSYLSPKLGLACSMDLDARAAEGTLLPNIGFRCCRE